LPRLCSFVLSIVLLNIPLTANGTILLFLFCTPCTGNVFFHRCFSTFYCVRAYLCRIAYPGLRWHNHNAKSYKPPVYRSVFFVSYYCRNIIHGLAPHRLLHNTQPLFGLCFSHVAMARWACTVVLTIRHASFCVAVASAGSIFQIISNASNLFICFVAKKILYYNQSSYLEVDGESHRPWLTARAFCFCFDFCIFYGIFRI